MPPQVIPDDAKPPWQGVPVGSKRLDVQPEESEMGGVRRLKVTFGVYFSPEEFVLNVQQLRHPFDVPLPLDDANMAAIAFILKNGLAAVAKHRADVLKHYVDRAKELQHDEAALQKGLDSLLQPVLRSKKLLLFRDDATLVDEMCDGFRLVGDLNPSGQFKQQLKPAAISVDQLRQTAVWAQKAVVSSCRKVLEDNEIAVSVWEETMQQASDEKRWVIGPFSSSEMTERLVDHWIPSKRVGVRQSGKIRAIDDFSQYLINSAVTCHEKLDLEGIDSICATARFFLGAQAGDGFWEIPDENGAQCGNMAASWKGRCASDLYGRCLDLKHAYKQLGRNPADN